MCSKQFLFWPHSGQFSKDWTYQKCFLLKLRYCLDIRLLFLDSPKSNQEQPFNWWILIRTGLFFTAFYTIEKFFYWSFFNGNFFVIQPHGAYLLQFVKWNDWTSAFKTNRRLKVIDNFGNTAVVLDTSLYDAVRWESHWETSLNYESTSEFKGHQLVSVNLIGIEARWNLKVNFKTNRLCQKKVSEQPFKLMEKE